MRDDIQKTVEVLRDKIRMREEEASRLKKIINDLYVEEGESAPYPNISAESAATLNSLRSDQFYGQTMAGAARQYFEMRKASGLGASSISEIFQALKKGGFRFDAKNDDYSKNALRIALRKNSVTFHRLPNADFGLLEWYERPKPALEDDVKPAKSKKRKGHKRQQKANPENQEKEEKATKTVQNRQNGSKGSHTARILGILKSDATRDWDHIQIREKLPDLEIKSIRPLLYRLVDSGKAEKIGKGRFKAVLKQLAN